MINVLRSLRSLVLLMSMMLLAQVGWGQQVWSGGSVACTSGSNGSWINVAQWCPSGNPTSGQIAQFGANGSASTIGINMNGITVANKTIGAIEILSANTTPRTINNSSSTVAGFVVLRGASINSISNVILRNNSSTLLTIADGGTQSFGISLGNTTVNIINIDGSGGITISTIIKDSTDGAKNLFKGGSGAGILTLSGANTYSGNTTISGGTLALSGSGSISSSPQITIGSSGTFDVTARTIALSLGASQSLRSSATGSNTTGTLTVTSAKGLTLSAGGLVFTAYGGGATSPLTVTGASAGSLALNSAPITVTTTSALAVGSYTLIAKGGSATGVTGTPGTLNIDGSGLAPGTTGSLSVSSGQLILTVSAAAAQPSLSISGTSSHGSVCPNASANSITYTITNNGTVAADGITVTSGDAQFVVSGLSSTSIAASGGTATYAVTFTPSSSGAKSATITVASTTGGSNSPTSSLTGTGTTPVSQAVTSSAASSVTAKGATLNGNLTTLGVCPATTEKGFVYSLTSANNDPTNGGAGVTKTSVSGISTGAYTLILASLASSSGYSYKAYAFDGTTYTYGAVQTFTTSAALTIAGTTGHGSVCPSVPASSITYTITNGGNIQVDDLQVVSSDVQFVVSSLSSTSISASGTATYVVTFTPSSSGSKSSTITVSSSTNGIANATSSLTGTGTTPVTPVVVSSAASSITTTGASLNGSVTALGVCPATTQKGFVYSVTGTNNDPVSGGVGVTSTAVSSLVTGAYALALSGLPNGAQYSYKAFLFDGSTYTYGAVQTFTTLIPPANDDCSGAITLTVNAAAITGDFTNSTPMSGATKKDVFYQFTPGVTGSYTVSVNGFSVASDKDIYIYSICPSTYSASINVVGSGTTSSTTTETATATLTAGTSYKVLIQDYGGGGGTFSISVTAPIYYSKSTGDLNSTSTWGTNTDGSGSNPSNFTNSNQIFCIYNNPTPTISASWTVSGIGSKIVVGDGSNASNFTIPSALTCTATIDVAAAATLTIQSSTAPTLGALAGTSTVVYSSSSSQTVTAGTYANLDLTGGDRTISGTVNIAGTYNPGSGNLTVTGSTIVFNGSTAQTIPAATYNNLTTSNSAACTTSGNVIVGGTLSVSQNLTVGSSSILTINSGASVTIASSKSLTVSASGTLQNNSTTAFTVTGTMTVNGTYVHNANSQTIPSTNTTYTTGSYLKVGNGGSNITTVNPVLPACSASNAPNVIWDCPQQTQTNIFLSATPAYVNNLSIVNTGTGYVSNGLTSTARVLNVLGDLSILGGKYYITGNGSNTAIQTLNVSGNVSVSGGTLDLNAGTNTGSGILNIQGNLNYTSGSISRSNQSSGKGILSFNGVSQQTISCIAFVGIVDVTTNNSNGVLLSSDLTISGVMTLTAGTISIGNNTLTLSGSLSGGSSGSYVRTNGSGSFVVNSISTTGRLFPIGNTTYNPITIANGSGYNWSARVEDAVNNVQAPFDFTKAVLRTWHIAPSTNPPTSGADITFQYDDGDATQLGTNYSKTENLQLWHYGSFWTSAGTAMTPTGTANGVRTVTQTGLTRFSPYALTNVTGPLPASLLDFSGYKDGFKNQLRWVTATETNNRGFQIERSSDGQNYQSIGFVNSLAIGGNSQTLLKYSFADANPAGIKQYYRLKQTDIDGRNTLSNILLIQNEKPKSLEIASAFPNPSNGQLTLLLSAPDNQQISIRLFDMAGRLLETRSVNVLAGNNSIAFDLSKQPKGQYLIQAGEKTIRVGRE